MCADSHTRTNPLERKSSRTSSKLEPVPTSLSSALCIERETQMLLSADQYKAMREMYCYDDLDCRFEIMATPDLHRQFIGKYEGIFPRTVPQHYSRGINLRWFELIVQSVFTDTINAKANNEVTPTHVDNLKAVVCAVVHWKMASQGGRAKLNVVNVQEKWNSDTVDKIIKAYRRKNLKLFKIGGVRIPTATAFLRFLFPDEYGIMDSRVVKITQRNNITQLDLRDDGYIIDKNINIEQYNQNYNPFLVAEAKQLNNVGILFEDIDEHGNTINYTFRPCDIEMALF